MFKLNVFLKMTTACVFSLGVCETYGMDTPKVNPAQTDASKKLALPTHIENQAISDLVDEAIKGYNLRPEAKKGESSKLFNCSSPFGIINSLVQCNREDLLLSLLKNRADFIPCLFRKHKGISKPAALFDIVSRGYYDVVCYIKENHPKVDLRIRDDKNLNIAHYVLKSYPLALKSQKDDYRNNKRKLVDFIWNHYQDLFLKSEGRSPLSSALGSEEDNYFSYILSKDNFQAQFLGWDHSTKNSIAHDLLNLIYVTETDIKSGNNNDLDKKILELIRDNNLGVFSSIVNKYPEVMNFSDASGYSVGRLFLNMVENKVISVDAELVNKVTQIISGEIDPIIKIQNHYQKAQEYMDQQNVNGFCDEMEMAAKLRDPGALLYCIELYQLGNHGINRSPDKADFYFNLFLDVADYDQIHQEMDRLIGLNNQFNEFHKNQRIFDVLKMRDSVRSQGIIAFWEGCFYKYGSGGFDLDLQKAISSFKKGGQLGDIPCSVELAFLFLETKNASLSIDDSMELFKKAIKSNSYYGYLNYEVGNLYALKGNHKMAFESYLQANTHKSILAPYALAQMIDRGHIKNHDGMSLGKRAIIDFFNEFILRVNETIQNGEGNIIPFIVKQYQQAQKRLTFLRNSVDEISDPFDVTVKSEGSSFDPWYQDLLKCSLNADGTLDLIGYGQKQLLEKIEQEKKNDTKVIVNLNKASVVEKNQPSAEKKVEKKKELGKGEKNTKVENWKNAQLERELREREVRELKRREEQIKNKEEKKKRLEQIKIQKQEEADRAALQKKNEESRRIAEERKKKLAEASKRMREENEKWRQENDSIKTSKKPKLPVDSPDSDQNKVKAPLLYGNVTILENPISTMGQKKDENKQGVKGLEVPVDSQKSNRDTGNVNLSYREVTVLQNPISTMGQRKGENKQGVKGLEVPMDSQDSDQNKEKVPLSYGEVKILKRSESMNGKVKPVNIAQKKEVMKKDSAMNSKNTIVFGPKINQSEQEYYNLGRRQGYYEGNQLGYDEGFKIGFGIASEKKEQGENQRSPVTRKTRSSSI